MCLLVSKHENYKHFFALFSLSLATQKTVQSLGLAVTQRSFERIKTNPVAERTHYISLTLVFKFILLPIVTAYSTLVYIKTKNLQFRLFKK